VVVSFHFLNNSADKLNHKKPNQKNLIKISEVELSWFNETSQLLWMNSICFSHIPDP